jgi:cytochrome bd-type quinol oxidase subunit 2
MEHTVRKLLWIGPIIMFFTLLDSKIPDVYVLGGSIRSGYWGLCGALCGYIVKNVFREFRTTKSRNSEEAKVINEQIKIISSFMNYLAIGIIGATVIIKINELEKMLNWSSLIFFILGCYVHYLAIVIAGCRKSESKEDYE